MLTLAEKIIFVLAAVVSLAFTIRACIRITKIVARGAGRPDWNLARSRLGAVLVKVVSLQPTFKLRFATSLLHALVAWGFIYYLLINLGEVLEAFIPNFTFLGRGAMGNLYRLGADILTAATLTGMVSLLVRRFILDSEDLKIRADVLVHPKSRSGIRRDSLIVGVFILVHVGSRLWGSSLHLAGVGPDPWQPIASLVSGLWRGLGNASLIAGEHAAFWLGMGSILGFFPYFLYSKHIHLFITPINFLLNPERRSMGELERLDFDDETIEQFGAQRLEDLGWSQILDGYACIMCNRCQEACPAYATGKILSPAALEINKRYILNVEGASLAKGEASSQTLTESIIPDEAVWACTACGACIEVCPVGNEPMRDILDIRRGLVLMENSFPTQLQNAFRGMERTTNPWNINPAERMDWARGLTVPTIDQEPAPELLWWVGCAPATEARAQKSARAFAQILTAAGVRFAVLGQHEQCTGDAARRAGNEFLFNELAKANVEILNEVNPKRIVTTCPHCLHTLKNEYPAFGGTYTVVHHTQLIQELLAEGKIKNRPNGESSTVTYHDPCYLGRQNDIVDEPRQLLNLEGINLVEMARTKRQSFCCGAGGAQMWKEEEAGQTKISAVRYEEALKTRAETLTVSCPFCLIMLGDAASESESPLPIADVAEVVLDRLESA